MERNKPIPENAAMPEPLEVNFDGIPEQLRPYPHFVVWNYATIDDEIKKPPIDPKTGRRASVRRPDTWGRRNLDASIQEKIQELISNNLSIRTVAAQLQISTRTVLNYKL